MAVNLKQNLFHNKVPYKKTFTLQALIYILKLIAYYLSLL